MSKRKVKVSKYPEQRTGAEWIAPWKAYGDFMRELNKKK